MHIGSAFEGAVGSQWKIDATHVSPDVTVAARLNLAADYYGVPMLLSESVFNSCTVEMQAMMRLVDKVSIKGLKEPANLYTIEIE